MSSRVESLVASGHVAEIATAVRGGQVRAREVFECYLDRIAKHDGTLGCYLRVDADGARRRGDGVDAALASGATVGPLAGVPIGIKDIFCTEGIETTCASKILKGFIPPYESTVTARLSAAGAIGLGKLNMDEFAMGSSNENSAFGPVRNPWDPARVPGGSSGGSAAAVAAGLCAASLGTDTGGSIRQPAALCGVTGVKATYGRVSRWGVIAFASSLDHPGPFGRTIRDAAWMLSAIAGYDPNDSTSIAAPVGNYVQACAGGVSGLRVGVPEEYFSVGLEPEIESAVRAAVETIRQAGATVVPVSLPHTRYAVAAYYLISTAEAASNLARYDGIRYGHRATNVGSLEELYARTRGEGFGSEPKRRIMLGTYVLRSGYYDAYYGKAQRVRRLITNDFQAAFADCDVIATPTSPISAFKIGEKISDPLALYLADVYTVGPSLAGLPALSQPCGFSSAGLPIGWQLIAPPLGEETLFRVGGAYEAATSWHQRRPRALFGTEVVA